MTKEITKAYIIQQIQDKFKLREFEPETFTFRESVIPVYDVSQHLLHTTADYKEAAITGTGPEIFFIVPDDQRWHLNGYNVVFMGAGAYTVAGIYVSRVKQQTIGATVYLDLKAAQSVSYSINLPKVVRLDPGDKLVANVDGYTSPQNLRLYIDYVSEEIR